MIQPSIRLRSVTRALLELPWETPLEDWSDQLPFRALPVGPSRHLVRFIELDQRLLALKELPIRTARAEYDVLRELEAREFPSVRALGLVERHDDDAAILVTEYLQHSFQFRRFFKRLPEGSRKHRERLLDAMASLLVDLHRSGVFWGDCSLANTLFRRDGQTLQAFFVDAETSEVHPSLSRGQRLFDLEILVENVAGDLADLGALVGRDPELVDDDIAAAQSVADRYHALWAELHREVTIGSDERYMVEAHIRRLHDLGFGVEEVALDAAGPDRDVLKLRAVVTSRRFHAQQLRALTGLDVGEGQARILLNDLRAYEAGLACRTYTDRPHLPALHDRWIQEVFLPGSDAAVAALGGKVDPIQAYCDLLEVRWLLSEIAGRDVGTGSALEALSARTAPPESSAIMAIADQLSSTVAAEEADPDRAAA